MKQTYIKSFKELTTCRIRPITFKNNKKQTKVKYLQTTILNFKTLSTNK